MLYCSLRSLVCLIGRIHHRVNNNANVVIDRHPLLAGYLLGYVSIIRGAVVDAPFNRATTNNFDLELSLYY
jgi:hypothetical protein